MYKDAIVECPKGLGAVTMEFIQKGLTKFITFDDQGQPERIEGGINWFAFVPDAASPCLAYLRAEEHIIAELQSLTWDNVNILAVCGLHGDYDPITETWQDIFELIQDNPTALATYENYCYEPKLIDKNTNPLFGQFKVMGRWA
jgi:hypothetical protein